MNEQEPVIKDDVGKSRIDLLPESAIVFAKTVVYKFYLEIRENKTEDKLIVLGEMILDHTSLKDVGLVLAFGASKYSENSWQTIDDPNRYWVALGRHLEDEDAHEGSLASDSGLTHMAHAMCNVLFLLDLLYPKKKEDKWEYKRPEPLTSIELAKHTISRVKLKTTHNYPND